MKNITENKEYNNNNVKSMFESEIKRRKKLMDLCFNRDLRIFRIKRDWFAEESGRSKSKPYMFKIKFLMFLKSKGVDKKKIKWLRKIKDYRYYSNIKERHGKYAICQFNKEKWEVIENGLNLVLRYKDEYLQIIEKIELYKNKRKLNKLMDIREKESIIGYQCKNCGWFIKEKVKICEKCGNYDE